MSSTLSGIQAESLSEVPIRPAFLVNQQVFLSYAPYIRRILVGLTGTAHASALVCPASVDAETVLCPSVERIEHPALQLPIFRMQNRNALLERLGRFKPTLLHTFYPGQLRLARWLGRMLDVPYVISFHRPPSRWLHYTESVLDADRLIGPSKAIVTHLNRNWPRMQDRVDQIHPGTFAEDKCSCFSRPDCVTSMVAVHPLNSLKVFAPFLNAVRHLALDGHELMAALMGEGPAENAIRSHIRKLGLTSIVTVIPPMRPVRTLLGGADIYLHLSDESVFDGQLLEAMAVGLAVAGVPDSAGGLLEDGKTALFWDPLDELAIYARLKQLLSAREQTRYLAMNAQQHIRRHNSVSCMVDKLMATYAQAQQWHKQTRKTQEEPPVPQTVH